MTTRRDFMKTAGAAMVGTLGFPAAAFTYPRAAGAAPSTGARRRPPIDDTGLVTSGQLSHFLPLRDRAALREINVRLTKMAIDQCAAGGGARNQIEFGTLICRSLAELAAHDVFPHDLLALSRDCDVVFPWSLLYGNARQPFNTRLVRVPLIIAYPRTVQEVVFWVNFVSDHALSVAIRSGGNSYEGLSSLNQVVIDLTFLTLGIPGNPDAQFSIDPGQGVVHVTSGVRLGVLYTELFKAGFALAGGQCAPVCIGGLVGTGGIGFLTRRFGWACDQLVEVEHVLADGRVVVANAGNQYADLYRASKGAGAAGLGVMTRLTVKIVPATTVLVWTVPFPGLEDGAAVLEAWQNLAANAPDGLSSTLAAQAGNERAGAPVLFVTGEFRVEGVTVDATTATLVDVLRTQWLNRLPPPLNLTPIDIQAMTAIDAATAVAELVPMPLWDQWKLKSRFTFRSLTAAQWQPMFDYIRTHVPSKDPTKAVGSVNPWLMGGASNRIDPDSAAIPVRENAVTWLAFGALWNDPLVEDQALAWVEGLTAVIDQTVQSPTAFYGSPELELGSQLTSPPTLGYLDAYWKSPTHNFVPFLREVKQKYDPTDVFKGPQTIPVGP